MKIYTDADRDGERICGLSNASGESCSKADFVPNQHRITHSIKFFRSRSDSFDLVELILDLKANHLTRLRSHGIFFKLVTPERPVCIRTARSMVTQILENLISNSIHWMGLQQKEEGHRAPTITVRVEADPPSVTFLDNGPGIGPENSERIFQPFWSQKERAGGRGLGLFIARECATYIGGRLLLTSQVDPHTQRLHEFILELPSDILVDGDNSMTSRTRHRASWPWRTK